MAVTMTREAFEGFLWDNGISLPFPLHLGPAGPSGLRPELLRREREFDEEQALRRGLYPPSVVSALAELIHVMESPDAIAFSYSMVDARDDAETRWVSAGVIRGNDALVITEAPEAVHLQQVAWSDVASAVVASVPPMLGMTMPRVQIRVDALGPLTEALESGAPERTVERAASAAGLPAGLHGRMAQLKARAEIGGFVGATREWGDHRVLSPVSGDFYAAPDGGVLRWTDGVEMTFEPVSTTALARVLGVALSRLPSAASVGV